jgi:hypothetical protein
MQETAINIGYACSLITDEMTQFQLTGACAEVELLEAQGKVRVLQAAARCACACAVRAACCCMVPACCALTTMLVSPPRRSWTRPRTSPPSAWRASCAR